MLLELAVLVSLGRHSLVMVTCFREAVGQVWLTRSQNVNTVTGLSRLLASVPSPRAPR